jgi:tetratricopeptide (TPR) repeat protein
VLWEFGQNAEGRALLERALALDPNNVWALSRLADAQFGDSEYRAAVDSARRAMAMDPLDFGLKADSTFKFLSVGQVNEALSLAGAVLERDPDSFDGLRALGNVYWRTGDHSEAFRLYYRLLQDHPNTYFVYQRIAQSFSALGDFESAQHWLERAAAVNPERARLRMAWLCWLAGDVECARSYMREIIQDLDPEDPQEREWLAGWTADLAWVEEDWPRALEGYRAQLDMVEDRGAMFTASRVQVDAAYIAERANDLPLRDELLALAEAANAQRIVNGSDNQYVYWIEAELHALRGDAAATAEDLRRAMDHGLRQIAVIERSPFYDKVRDEPEMQALIADLRLLAAQELEELQAAERELVSG